MLARTLLNTDPFMGLSREMDRLFETFAPAGSASPAALGGGRAPFPMLNAWQTDEALVIEAELPGFRRDDLSLTITEDSLTLKGERRIEHPEGARVIRAERVAGRFERTMRLPVPVASEKANAEFQDGVLRITLPKAAAVMPRRIEITSGDSHG